MRHHVARKPAVRRFAGTPSSASPITIITENVIAFLYFIFAALETFGGFRYVIYLIPPILFVVSFFYHRGLRPGALSWYALLVASLIVPAALGRSEAAMHPFFFAFGISIATLRIPVRTEMFVKITYAVLAAQALHIAIFGGVSLSFLSLSSVEREFESHTFPFILGSLVGLFYCARRYAMMFFCLVGLVLAAKRMPIAAAMIGLSSLFVVELVLPRRVRSLVYSFQFFIVPFAIFCAFTWYMPDIFDLLEPYVHISMGEFTSGRSNGQIFAYDRLYSMSFLERLIGDGLGAADAFAQKVWDIPGILIHSDYLRLLLDLGWVATLVYLAGYWRLVYFGPLGLYISFFVFCNFVTDNSMIYTFSHILIALMGLWAQDRYEGDGQPVADRPT